MRLVSFLFLAAWLSAAENKAPPWEKPAATTLLGQNLYRENCAVCHDVDKDQSSTRKIGPSLRHLFKNKKLPLSGGRPSREYVTIRIQYGGPIMPSFRKSLNDSQVAALLAYLESK
jgi:mono/diheme cytochrome c family protein